MTAAPVRLAVRRDGEGPAVVLLHGLCLDGRMWDGIVPHLVKAGFSAVRIDLRGHGKSPAVDREATLEDFAADTIACLERERIEHPHLLGFSMGGMTAMRVAAAGHPHLLKSLILVSTSGEEELAERKPQYEQQLQMMRAIPLTAPVADLFFSLQFTPGWLDKHPPAQERYRTIFTENDKTGIYWAGVAVNRRGAVLDRLRSLRLPATVISGTADHATIPAHAAHLAEAIPGARLVSIEGAPHALHEERQPQFLDALLSHLKEST